MKYKFFNVFKITLICLAILFLGLISSSTTYAQTYSHIGNWGNGLGWDKGQFQVPYDVAVDSSGNVYVADNLNSRIQKFDRSYKYLTQWGGGGYDKGKFYFTTGVAVDSSGYVYVTETGNNRVQKFDVNGNYLTQWGSYGTTGNEQFNNPYDVAIDSNSNVYIADSSNNRILKFDNNGNYLTQWGTSGSGDGQFSSPKGIAIDSSGNVYVTDSGNNRIEKFDSNGKYLTQWGSKENASEQLKNPWGVAVDLSGYVYVSDTGHNRIEKFDSNGKYLTQWGSWGRSNGQFDSPLGIAVDSSGDVYVADSGNNRIQAFAIDKNVTPPALPTANFNAIVTSGKAPLVVKFTDQSENATEWKWDFGDGATSTDQNPTHTYPTEGTYTVKLTATNNAGNDVKVKSDFINVKNVPQALVADFTSNVKSGHAPLSVTFTDSSTGTPTSWSWDFGDGATSTDQNPTHTFAETGSYTVTLTVMNEAGSNSISKDNYVLTTAKEPNTKEDDDSISASINLHGEKTKVVKGEDVLLKLSAVNIITKPTMHVQAIIIPPSGMSVSSSEFVESGAGQYTATFDIEPGKGRDIEVKIAANQVGNFNVSGRVVYYFGDDKKDAKYQQLDLPIQVSDNSPIPKSTPTHNPSSPQLSGFYALSLVFLLILVFILRRK